MSTTAQEPNFIELLKIPESQHKPETLALIKAHRKKLADTFFDKSKSAEERNKLVPELNAINKYFGYKEVYENKVAGKGGGTYIATKEQRADNCNNFMKYLDSAKPSLWQVLKPEEQAQLLAIVWGSVKT